MICDLIVYLFAILVIFVAQKIYLLAFHVFNSEIYTLSEWVHTDWAKQIYHTDLFELIERPCCVALLNPSCLF